MNDEEISELEKMGPSELVMELENAIIDLASGNAPAMERIRELRRIIVRRLKLADQAAGALT